MAKANRMVKERELVVYTGANGVKINALADVNTVWLNRQQLAVLFGRDVKTIGKHIANALKEELRGMATVAKFATTQTEGVGTQMPNGIREKRPFSDVANDAHFVRYATIEKRPACVLNDRSIERKRGFSQLWRRPRRGRCSHIEKSPLMACRDSDLRSYEKVGSKCNIEVMAGTAEPQSSPTPQTSMDVSILLNGVCDVNGEPLLK